MSQKKGKKKGKRKDDEWEDEVANELEQVQLNDGKDRLNKTKIIENKNVVFDKTNKKKRKGKKGKEDLDSDEESKVLTEDAVSKSVFGLLDVEDIEEDKIDDIIGNEGNVIKDKRTKESSTNNGKQITDEVNDISINEISKTEPGESTKTNSDEEEEFNFKKEKRKEKKGKNKKVSEEDKGDILEEEPMMKTAAQKRAEKKERDKKKKEAQKKKAKETTTNKNETEQMEEVEDSRFKEETVVEEISKNKETDDQNVTVKNVEIEDDQGEDKETKDNEKDEGEEGDEKKKKKKKKKKTKEEDAPKTKKPARGVIKQMQEALEKAKQEEERFRQEQEAKQRALEEAENQRLEKLRLEQERKERQKQKEKERKQRLKEEGKLLTKAQKQQRAQTEAKLQAMRQQGIAIPNRGETEQNDVKKPVRYGKKKPKQPKEKGEVVETEEGTDDKTKTTDPTGNDPKTNEQPQEDMETDLITEKPEKFEGVNKVKDTWDDDDGQKIENDIEPNTTNNEKESETEDNEDEEKQESDNDEDEGEESSEETETDSDEDTKSSEDESLSKEEREFERAKSRIKKRREKAETKRTKDKLRSPVICVMGHVDTGKTKILDKIRHSHVQDGEAGGITQQIGATNVPPEAIGQQTKMIKDFCDLEMKIPGLLIIDTPGHESFSNLRSRGSTLCDMAILVVDIMHGLEPQTIESINLLRAKKTPFVVALNKVDRLFEWKRGANSSIVDTLKKQNRNTKQEFEERLNHIIGEFAAEGLNAVLFNKNVDTKTYISLVPTSAHSGDGMGDLIALIVKLCQTKLAPRLSFSDELQCTVLEVKAITGLGTTIDVILTNGRLAETQTIVLGGIDGPIVTQVRALLMPQPLKELRVKNQYATFKEIEAAQGVKITGKELDKALAGSPLFVAYQDDEIAVLKREVTHIVNQSLKAIKVSERGVCVQASTLGSLEALLEFLKTSKIPYCSVSVGPVHKKDVMKASVMLEHDIMFAVILAFDVKVERDAQELADSLGVKIFTADIIYHLFDKFTNYREELKQKKRDEFKHIAVFPCKLRILSEHIYNTRDPIIVGVTVEAGIVKEGSPICVPSKEFVEAGIITGIEANHKTIEKATKGMEVCIKIEPIPGEAPKMYGRHFDYTDLLVSKISRESIDAVKEYFRDDLQKSDWQLMIELKKLFKII